MAADNAREKIMELLFDETIRALRDRIASGEVTPADLNVARQMLKDNGISATARNKALQGLAESVDPNEDEQLNDTPPAYKFGGK